MGAWPKPAAIFSCPLPLPSQHKFFKWNASMSLTALGVVIVVAVVLLVLLRPRKRGGRKQVPSSLPVRAKKYFFSQAERQFYETLKQALPSGLVAFPNVQLQDVFYISARGKNAGGCTPDFRTSTLTSWWSRSGITGPCWVSNWTVRAMTGPISSTGTR